MLARPSWLATPAVPQSVTMTTLLQAASEESGIEPGAIATITGSMSSLQRRDFYDTDNTDLSSEPDEAEIRRELLRDTWRQLFDKYDPEGFGEIPWPELMAALAQPDFRARVGPGKRELLLERARNATTTAITFQEFVNLMSGKRTRSFKCAVHQRDREVSSERDFRLASPVPLVKKMARAVADHVLTEERDRKYYADRYRCWPPPLFVLCVTLAELGSFAYHSGSSSQLATSGSIDSVLIYRPDKRSEVWRFVLYAALHVGWPHLAFNLAVQLVVGLPLEMVHGSVRIAAVYLAGVAAGSLGTSVFDPDVVLVGASGGVYALLAAHLANVLLNYSSMRCGALRLLLVLAVASCDVGYAVYSRYAAPAPAVSYVAHLTGALAGLTIGLLVLKNFEQRLRDQLLWWVALGVYAACTLFAVLFNVLNPTPAAVTATSR